MASARKKSAAGKSKGSKPSGKRASSKVTRARKAAPSRAKPAPKKPARKVVKAVSRKPAPKPVHTKAAKGLPAKGIPAKGTALKGVPAKVAAVKGAPLKGGPAKGAAVKGAALKGTAVKGTVLKGPHGKGAPAAKPGPVVKAKPPRLVPATAEARALAAQAARAAKPGAKGKALRPEPEVRPLGVLPPSSQAKPRLVPPPRPAPRPVRPVAPARPAPRPPSTRKGDERLTPDDFKYFEQRLISERSRIMGEMGHLENTVLKVNPRDAAGELSGYSYHMADAGTDSMEREKAFDIASKEGRLLLEIDDALRRVYNGTFGVCEVSGKPIARSRLEALPWARLSIDEQEKLEKEQRSGRLASTEKE